MSEFLGDFGPPLSPGLKLFKLKVGGGGHPRTESGKEWYENKINAKQAKKQRTFLETLFVFGVTERTLREFISLKITNSDGKMSEHVVALQRWRQHPVQIIKVNKFPLCQLCCFKFVVRWASEHRCLERNVLKQPRTKSRCCPYVPKYPFMWSQECAGEKV